MATDKTGHNGEYVCPRQLADIIFQVGLFAICALVCARRPMIMFRSRILRVTTLPCLIRLRHLIRSVRLQELGHF